VVADEADGVTVPSRANVTWLSAPSETGMVRQRLRLLRDLAPRCGRVAVLFNPDSPANARAVGASWLAAAEVLLRPARTIEEVERALATVPREAGGVVVPADTLFAVHARRLVDLLTEARVPAVYGARTFVDAGGLGALYGDTGDTIRRTAALVRELLAGVPAAELGPEPPPRPQVALNAAAAARLGLAIPPALLAQAAR
jgi:putative ABC transport system substrate-binding protein